MIAQTVIACTQCGKPLRRKPSKRHAHNFCNRACFHVWIAAQYPPQWRCDRCGEPVRRVPSRVVGRVYCSRECFTSATQAIPTPAVAAIPTERLTAIGKRPANDPYYAARDAARDPHDPDAFDRAILLERRREQRLLAAYDDEAEAC